MANTIVTIEGTIVNAYFYTPPGDSKAKPHIRIELLQVSDNGSNLEIIKDDDLNALYDIGSQVKLKATAGVYYFNNKPGVSYKIFRGDSREISMKVSGGSSVSESKSKEKTTPKL